MPNRPLISYALVAFSLQTSKMALVNHTPIIHAFGDHCPMDLGWGYVICLIQEMLRKYVVQVQVLSLMKAYHILLLCFWCPTPSFKQSSYWARETK